MAAQQKERQRRREWEGRCDDLAREKREQAGRHREEVRSHGLLFSQYICLGPQQQCPVKTRCLVDCYPALPSVEPIFDGTDKPRAKTSALMVIQVACSDW